MDNAICHYCHKDFWAGEGYEQLCGHGDKGHPHGHNNIVDNAKERWREARLTPDPINSPSPEPAYADGNPKAAQGAKKYSLRSLPLPAAIEVNRALEDGCKKYGAANWRQSGVAATVYVDATLRHLMQWYDGGQKNANDSGVHNLGHAMACLAILIDAEAAGTLIDDRPYPCGNTDALLLRAIV